MTQTKQPPANPARFKQSVRHRSVLVGRSAKNDPEDLNRIGDILQRLLAQVDKIERKLVAHTSMDHVGDADPARLRKLFKTCSDIDAIAMDVLVLDDHIAKVDTNAKNYLPVVGFSVLPHRHAVLDFRRALKRIDDAAELDEKSISHRLDESAPVFVNGGSHHFVDLVVKSRPRTSLIHAH